MEVLLNKVLRSNTKDRFNCIIHCTAAQVAEFTAAFASVASVHRVKHHIDVVIWRKPAMSLNTSQRRIVDYELVVSRSVIKG
jgi:hypothetical protein